MTLILKPSLGGIGVAIGAELRRMRVDAGLTQGRFAVLIDSHRPIVSRIERGKHVPTLEVCQLYAAVTGQSVRRVARVIDRVCGLRRPRVSARRARNQELAA